MNFWKTIKKPIIGLAPMDGVTDPPMRRVQCEIASLADDCESRRAKPDVVYTEFVSAEGFIRNPPAFEKTLFFEEDQRPIVAQIFGYAPEAFYETITQITKLNFDGIDLNMGCPAKSVLGKGGGGALIGNYELTEKIILASLKAIKKAKKNIPLSVKTRIGINNNIIDEWIGFLSGFPLAEITVHGRLLKNGHHGDVDWEEIAKAANILKTKKIICLGNGGIKSRKEANIVCQKYSLDGVLIGQAALGNPWVFLNDYCPTKEEILETILKHAKYVEEFYPPERFVTIYKHFGWYPKGFKNCKLLKIELMKTKNYEEVKKIVAKFGQFC